MHRHLVLIGLLTLSLAGCRFASDRSDSPLSSPSVKAMKLESSAFTANGLIPAKYTCDGEDLSPPLSWDAPPAGTQTLALIADDPDAPRGTWVHWVAYNLPTSVHQLPEGIPPEVKLAVGGTQGKNDFDRLGYGGPCPPGGTHRYFFKLYAIDRELSLPQSATKAQLLQAMEGHILANAELMGRYTRGG